MAASTRLSNWRNWGLALLSLLLLVLAFPNFHLWPLAWIGLVPLLLAIGQRPSARRAFLLGWVTGSGFFYATCYWLTYSMIRYAGIPAALAFALLVPGAALLGLFPGIFAMALARLVQTRGVALLFAAPFLWVSLEWLRLTVTGQLWNAIGYSQAFHPLLIQTASIGGVYAIGFLILVVNAAVAFALTRRTAPAIKQALLVITGTAALAGGVTFPKNFQAAGGSDQAPLEIVALQPNVPMEFNKTQQELDGLLNRHLSQSEAGLNRVQSNGPRLVIWPESPMYFTYGNDQELRQRLARFTTQNHVSLLLNSQEQAVNDSPYNSALLINEEGRLTAQYDKIRLMPFGEYVPLPRWLPGADRVTAIVGGFSPGKRFTLMPVGNMHAGVFICIESAYPWIPRTLANEGADVLINISNDGYLGPTPVMHQHLANTILRAVENGRPVLRVTNTGISAYIDADGNLRDTTGGFQEAVRNWTVSERGHSRTFYTRHGDVFVGLCSLISVLLLGLTLRARH